MDAPDAISPRPAADAIAHEGGEGQAQFAGAVEQAQASGQRVKVRLLCQLYDPEVKRYVQWKGQNQRISLNPGEPHIGDRLGLALKVALQALGRLGPEQFCHILQTAQTGALPLSAIDTSAPDADEDPES